MYVIHYALYIFYLKYVGLAFSSEIDLQLDATHML